MHFVAVALALFGVAVLVAAGAYANALAVQAGYTDAHGLNLATTAEYDTYSAIAREAADQGATLRRYASTWALIILVVVVLLVLYHFQESVRMGRRVY